MAAAATISIERALADFLGEQRSQLADASFRKYVEVVDLLVSSLNNYGHDVLSERERRRFGEAYDAGDEQAFCHLFGPEKIPAHLPIERIEPGALWFEGGIGPLAVSKAASELAEVGWEGNVVLARTANGWRLLEVGCVYP